MKKNYAQTISIPLIMFCLQRTNEPNVGLRIKDSKNKKEHPLTIHWLRFYR